MTAVQSDEMLVKAQFYRQYYNVIVIQNVQKPDKYVQKSSKEEKKKEEYLILSKSIHKYTVKNFILQIQP